MAPGFVRLAVRAFWAGQAGKVDGPYELLSESGEGGPSEIGTTARPLPPTIGFSRGDLTQPETRYAKSGDVHAGLRGGLRRSGVRSGFISNVEHYWDDPSYSRWLHRLARFARVISFDKRGTGLSDRVSTMPGMDAHKR
jgi:hypothetical protein